MMANKSTTFERRQQMLVLLHERPAQPAELAPVYVLLASPEASYVTGEVYGLTGGKSPT